VITWSAVVAIAPELASVALATQTAILGAVEVQLAAGQWGTRYDLACTYLAAHLGAVSLAGAQGAAGPVTSESVGSVSRSYAAPVVASSNAGSTAYGREYERLKKQLVGRIGVVC
jgi:hypothetical protein